MTTISVIVPYWGKTHSRNMDALRKLWSITDIPQGTELIISTPQGKVEKGAWLLSQLRNEGALKAQGDILVFHDCDALWDPWWLERIQHHAQKHLCFGAYNKVVYLDENESVDVIRAVDQGAKLFHDYKGRKVVDNVGSGCGMSFAIHRAVFERVGQWKAMPGWGKEDWDYRERCGKVLGIQDLKAALMPGRLLHLEHPGADKSWFKGLTEDGEGKL